MVIDDIVEALGENYSRAKDIVIEIEQDGDWIVLESLDSDSDALSFAIDYFLNNRDFSKLRVCSENGKIEYELVRP